MIPSCIKCKGPVYGDNFICDDCRDGTADEHDIEDEDFEAIINIENPFI